jgi:hypothetical protein
MVISNIIKRLSRTTGRRRLNIDWKRWSCRNWDQKRGWRKARMVGNTDGNSVKVFREEDAHMEHRDRNRKHHHRREGKHLKHPKSQKRDQWGIHHEVAAGTETTWARHHEDRARMPPESSAWKNRSKKNDILTMKNSLGPGRINRVSKKEVIPWNNARNHHDHTVSELDTFFCIAQLKNSIPKWNDNRSISNPGTNIYSNPGTSTKPCFPLTALWAHCLYSLYRKFDCTWMSVC